MLKKIYSNSEDLKTKLSIVIPTYNRIENLKLLLQHIANEKLNDIELVILDNKSKQIIDSEFLRENFFGNKIIHYQNLYNIHGDLNILRAYEIASSEWVYVIGDSKIPKKNFVSEILKDISKNKNLYTIIYNYASNLDEDIILDNIENLNLKRIDFGDLFLVGNSLVSKNAIIDYYKYATGIGLTHLPHSIFHIYSLIYKKKVLFRYQNIIEEFLKKPSDYNPGLNYLECLAFFPLIDTLLFNKPERKKIYKGTLTVYGETWRIAYHCLRFLFNKRLDISSHLERILNYRYNFFTIKIIYEKPMVYLLLSISRILKLIRYTK